jgi:FkbM family methyltransferase
MNNILYKTPQAIVADSKTLVRKILSFLGIEKQYTNQPFSMKDRGKLESAARFTEMQIKFFGKQFYIADAMTFLSGFKEIFKKEPYLFKFNINYPLIIDCGANIGLSVIYFKSNYPDAKVIAIEADPALFQLLKRNLESFGYNDVILLQKAVWYKDGIVKFKQEGGFSGQINNNNTKDDVVTVETITLEYLLRDKKVGFLKIDIEGAENDIFNNTLPNLIDVENVFIEYHSRKTENQSLHSILSILSEQGFRYHIHHEFICSSPFVNDSELVGMDLQLSIFGKK